MEILDKITIIVLTYNRPQYLKRILSFYASYNLPLNILVADSSIEENKKKNRKITDEFSLLKTEIHHFPSEEGLYEKSYKSLTKVKTKYCVFCADDDFVTVPGMKKAGEFLELHDDYAIAEGKSVEFFNVPFLFWSKFFWRGYYVRTSLDPDDPSERLKMQSHNYQLTFYGVHRTKQLAECFRLSVETGLSYHPFGELLPSFLTVIHGKIKRMNMFYGARDRYTLLTLWPPRPNLVQRYIDDGTFERRSKPFMNLLAKHLAKTTGKNIDEARQIVDKYVSVYFRKHESRAMVYHIRQLLGEGILFNILGKVYMLYKLPIRSLSKKNRMFTRDVKKVVQGSEEFNRVKRFVKWKN